MEIDVTISEMQSDTASEDISGSSSHQSPLNRPFDLISNLANYPHILEKIFASLRPKDLRIVPCVSLNWCEACYQLAPKANRRRLKSIKHLKKVKLRVGMENWPLDCECAVFKRKLRNQQNRNEQDQAEQQQRQPVLPLVRPSRPRRKTLGAIQNIAATNHKLPKCRKTNDRDSHGNTPSKPVCKKPRWTLAQEPFKMW